MASVVAVLVFCPLISALAFNAPAATPMADALKLLPQVEIPQPTEAPNLELHKRQSNVQYSLLEGPDSICGYQYGQSSGELGICGTSRCGFATAAGEIGEIICYGPTKTAPRYSWTSCIGGTRVSSCLADSACSDNPGIVVCTDALESYCNVGTWVGLGVEAVWCDSTYYTGMIPISTTYIGQVGRELTAVLDPALASSTSTSIISSPTPSPSVSLSRQTPTPTPTPTPPPQHPTPVGAIVGGVIGGLALVAAIAAGIFICLRMKRKDEQRAQAGAPPPVQTSAQPTSPGAQYPSEKYPATTGATVIPASTYQQPPPQAQYPPQQYQPPQQTWQPPQQQYPQQVGSYVEQPQQQPIQPYPHQDYKPQSLSPPPEAGRPQSLSPDALSAHRESMSGTSSPGSPAPPYPSSFPAVPEMTGENQMSHHAYPLHDQPSEMPT